MKQSTRERWEAICKAWENGLQHLSAKEAAEKIGTNPNTLVVALRTLRPGQYNPNVHKRRKSTTFVYENCIKCGKETCMRVDLKVIDKVENRKLGHKSMYMCKDCLCKLADLVT